MAIEIVDLPIKNGDFPVRYVKLPEGILTNGGLDQRLLFEEFDKPERFVDLAG